MSTKPEPYAPPAGFVPVESQVEGVVLFAPQAETTDPLEQRTRCPGCGATLAWDPGAQAMACSYCGTQLEARGGTDLGPGEFTEAATALGAQGWGTERPELRCDGCGAVLSVEKEQISATCPLCASSQVHLHDDATAGLRPTHVLAFSVERGTASTDAMAWLGSGWLRPRGIRDAVTMDQFRGIYVPFWVFHADMSAEYQVQVGTETTTTERRSDGSTVQKKTIHWRWVSGTHALKQVEEMVPATAHVAGVEAVKPFPSQQLVPYTPDVLVGFAAHAYDVSLPAGWEEGRQRLRQSMRSSCCYQHEGDHYRSFSGTIDFDEESWTYALLPVWVSAYRWNGRNWVVLVNGATGKVEGTRPVVWMRVYLAIAAMLFPGLFVGGCMGLPGLAFAGVGLAFLIVAFVLLIFGVIGSALVYFMAVDEETL